MHGVAQDSHRRLSSGRLPMSNIDRMQVQILSKVKIIHIQRVIRRWGRIVYRNAGLLHRSVFVMSWIAGSVRLRLVPRSKGSTVCMTWERMCGSGSTVSRSIPKSPLVGVGGMRPFGCIETIEQSSQETLPWCISDFAARQMCAKSRDLDLV